MPTTLQIVTSLSAVLAAPLRWLLLAVIWLYQTLISPLLGTNCRFYPSCSAYARTCLTTMSLGKAVVKTTKRLCRCHPGHPGGVDLP